MLAGDLESGTVSTLEEGPNQTDAGANGAASAMACRWWQRAGLAGAGGI